MKSKKFHRIYIEITNICNLNCSFCVKSKRVKRSLNIEEFKHIIEEVKDYTNTICLHVTGEPLLHPNLDEFLTICDQNQLSVILTTNGTNLSKVIPIFKHQCIKKLHISIHAEYKSVNAYQNILEAIDHVPSSLIVIYRLWNCKENELDSFSTNIVEKIFTHYKISPTLWKELITKTNIKLKENHYIDKKNQFEWPKLSNYKSDGFCQGLKSHIAILSDGTVVPCCLDADGIINLGNIFKSSLTDILNSSKAINIKNEFQNNKAVEKLCQSCQYKNRFNQN